MLIFIKYSANIAQLKPKRKLDYDVALHVYYITRMHPFINIVKIDTI